MNTVKKYSTPLILNTVFFRNKTKVDLLKNIMKNTFLKIDFFNYSNTKRRKSVFGKCISVKKAGYNSTITLLYSIQKYKIIETFSIYNNFIKTFTIYKQS